MAKHAHLLLKTGPSRISSLMRRLLTGYAGLFQSETKAWSVGMYKAVPWADARSFGNGKGTLPVRP